MADHDYEFSRNPRKLHLVERNRLITVFCDYPGPLLWRVLPALILVEIPLLTTAVLSGWGRQKLAAWWWVLRRRRWLADRRRLVQLQVTVSPAAIAEVLSVPDRPAHGPAAPRHGGARMRCSGCTGRGSAGPCGEPR